MGAVGGSLLGVPLRIPDFPPETRLPFLFSPLLSPTINWSLDLVVPPPLSRDRAFSFGQAQPGLS